MRDTCSADRRTCKAPKFSPGWSGVARRKAARSLRRRNSVPKFAVLQAIQASSMTFAGFHRLFPTEIEPRHDAQNADIAVGRGLALGHAPEGVRRRGVERCRPAR